MTDGERKQLAERIIELERENEMLRHQLDAIMHDIPQQVIPCPAQDTNN